MDSCIEQIPVQGNSSYTVFVLWHKPHLLVPPTMKGLHTHPHVNTHTHTGTEGEKKREMAGTQCITNFTETYSGAALFTGPQPLLSNPAVQTPPDCSAHAANGISRFTHCASQPADLLRHPLCPLSLASFQRLPVSTSFSLFRVPSVSFMFVLISWASRLTAGELFAVWFF